MKEIIEDSFDKVGIHFSEYGESYVNGNDFHIKVTNVHISGINDYNYDGENHPYTGEFIFYGITKSTKEMSKFINLANGEQKDIMIERILIEFPLEKEKGKSMQTFGFDGATSFSEPGIHYWIDWEIEANAFAFSRDLDE